MAGPALNSLGIGMSVSGANGNFGLGSLLQDQVAGETEEERRKRMAAMQQPGAAKSAAMQSVFGQPYGV
jgi:hypothetical protein